MAYLIFFAFGLIVGSFLNVVIYRYNTGRSVVRGRSRCFACGHNLRWFELVPLFSFLIQAGRCRRCQSRISWQYPLVELATGLLFLFTVYRFGLTPFPLLLNLVIVSLLLVITVYDWRHQIIPDGLVYSFIVLALLPAILSSDWLIIRDHFLAGIILFLFFFLLWWLSRGRWMGFGDSKLALGAGFFLGLSGGVSAIVFAFWLGAIFGLALLLINRLSSKRNSFTMKSEVPFAPFIVAGLLLNLFLNLNAFSLFKIF